MTSLEQSSATTLEVPQPVARPLKKRRFAMLCPNYYPLTCGIGDFSMRLARHLMARGAEVKLFTHAPAERNPECPAVEVHCADGRTTFQIVRALRDLIADYDPSDFIVQYVPHMLRASQFGSAAVPILMAEFKERATVTAILHELYRPWSWRPDLAAGAVLQRIQFASVAGACDRLFVTTAGRRRQVEQMLRAAGRALPVELIFIGANAPPLAQRRNSGPPKLGFFSTLARWRRFDLMIDAFALIEQRHPGAELVLIGDLGNTASLAFRALKEHITRSPVANKIRLTGALSLSKVAEEISALDVYLFPDEGGPSTRSSTLPIAFGSGIPVVAVRGQDTPTDFFIDGENVAYARAMSAADLAESSLRILEDSSWARQLSEGGRALYRRHLSWNVIADHLLPQREKELST